MNTSHFQANDVLEKEMEQKRDTPHISVLIVTWNRKKDILETVHSVYEQAYKDFEIIIVDNGSVDGTVDTLAASYPDVKLVALPQNLGVSSGRNAGIAIAKGEIIFCLDSDASLGQDSLLELTKKFQAEPDIGVINSKIVSAHTGVIDGGPGWAYSERQKEHQDQEFLSWSFSEGGAAIRKEVFNKVGLFWDVLFFGCEGQEFSLRVWDAGYKVLYFPRSIVYHRASPEKRMEGKERECQFLKNNLSIYITRYPLWLLFLMGPLKIGAIVVRSIRRGYLKDVLRTLAEVAKSVPRLSKLRKPIRNDTALLYLKLLRQQGPLSWNLFSWIKSKI